MDTSSKNPPRKKPYKDFTGINKDFYYLLYKLFTTGNIKIHFKICILGRVLYMFQTKIQKLARW